ncbi:MAG: hypothetical protein FJ118_02115 [Deltaproteobacteria bacterium]|nr:hypothetical protein [Deltaproteobacteria bacterium]
MHTVTGHGGGPSSLRGYILIGGQGPHTGGGGGPAHTGGAGGANVRGSMSQIYGGGIYDAAIAGTTMIHAMTSATRAALSGQ